MAITTAALRSSFESFFDGMANRVAAGALRDVPVLKGLELPAGQVFFATFGQQIDTALAAAGNTPAQLLEALNAIAGITATDDGDDFLIAINASDVVELVDEAFEAGGGAEGIGLAIDGEFATAVTAALNASLRVDGDTGALSIEANGGTDELTVSLEANLGVAAEGKLGFIDLEVADADPETPELSLSASIDLATGRADDAFEAPVDVEFAGSAAIDLALRTQVANGLLPGVSTTLHMEFDLEGGQPVISFNNVSIDIGSMLGVFSEMLVEVGEVFDSGALGKFIDFLTGPLPVIDSAVEKAGLNGWLDKLPTLIKDGDISLADLAFAFNGFLEDAGQENPQLQQLARFFEVVSYFDLVRDLFGEGEGGRINLGSFTVTNDPLNTVSTFIGIDPAQALNEFNQWIVDSGVFNEVEGFDELFTEELSINIPLFEDPSLIINILFNQLFDPVTLIELDLPKLELDASVDLFFRLLGPLGVGLEAGVAGLLDFDFGYDTRSFETGNIFDGIYVASFDDTGQPDPDGFVAAMDALFAGNVGVDIGIASAKIVGGVYFQGFGFLHDADDDGKTRLADIGECVLDPLTGRAWADLSAQFKVGIGFLSAKKTFTIAKAEFANFTYTACEPGISPKDLGLADWNDGTNGSYEVGDLILHTGAQAIFRNISGAIGNDFLAPEYYQIGNAVDSETGQAVTGRLVVSGFGVNQEYGNTDDDSGPVERIIGDLGNLDDSLIVAGDVTQTIDVGGGSGDDFISSGAGDDTLRGGADDDHLIGNSGDDQLFGGDGDDRLDGGVGADQITGSDLLGADFDEVSYEDANIGTGTGVRFYHDETGLFARGFGGEAEGDRLFSIEQITGTVYDDELISGNFAVLEGNIGKALFGLAGNDRLVGGTTDDFLLGGAGGDAMLGGSGQDATSYAFSPGAVYIDLQFHVAIGGEADGDYLDSIELVQGSAYGDALYGAEGANIIDGLAGDDVIDGRGGGDDIKGNLGNDTIYAVGDGDRLDGGGLLNNPGRDLLSYRFAGVNGIIANLGAGVAIVPGSIVLDTIVGSGPQGNDGTVVILPGISSFEDLEGSFFGDNLTGDNRANTVRGLSGDDVIDGGSGDDRLVGGAGSDLISGGSGRDWAEYRDSDAGVEVRLDGTAGIGGHAEGDMLNTVENLLGSDFSDNLFGDDGDNIIDVGLSAPLTADVASGGGGSDILVVDYSRADVGGGLTGGFAVGSSTDGGFARPDASGAMIDGADFTGFERIFVTGTMQSDTIYAGAGDDRIATGSGADTIYAGIGNDNVSAGDGDDFVLYSTNADRQLIAAGQDYQFLLDGNGGLDKLSVDLTPFAQDILLGGSPSQFNGINLALSNGAAIRGFEILGDIATAGGNDSLMQTGVVDNRFSTGDGNDTIASGLGVDVVDAGFSTEGIEIQYADGAPIAISWDVKFFEAFAAATGDTLILDYSTQDAAVRSIVSSVESELDPRDTLTQLGTLRTNQGVYFTRDDATPGLVIDQVTFREVEQLDVTGSRFGDVLVGADTDITQFGGNVFLAVPARFDTVRGADVLRGLEGDDLLLGYSGDDVLSGGDGNDELRGSWRGEKFGDDQTMLIDKSEHDDLTGGGGADRFVLGDKDGADYVESAFDYRNGAVESSALIRDFDAAEGDTLVLHGSSDEYSVGVLAGSTIIIKTVSDDDNRDDFFATGGDDVRRDLIAVLENVTDFDQTAAYVQYVDSASAPFASVANPAGVSGEIDLAPAPFEIEAAAASWVTQTADTALLLEALGSGSGVVEGSALLTIEGSSEGFGVFEADPFGLGKGILLSTGRVSDLDGPNTVSHGGVAPRDIPITFTQIGRFESSTIFRADLSGIGVDINSITLRDTNSQEGGAGGIASGFDIDALAFSNVRVDGTPGTALAFDLNGALPRLDVLEYNAATMFLKPGTQRPADAGFDNGPDLLGTINGMVDFRAATPGVFDRSSGSGRFSLGDGGEIGINLSKTLDTDGPVYLYVAESLGGGESIEGQITVSTESILPEGDLSTDLGAPGLDGDGSKMTYSFTPADGADIVTFQVVLFSEELPEHAGILPADAIKVTLNGVSIASLTDGQNADLNTLMTSPVYGAHPDLILNPAATGPLADTVAADGYTTTLTFAGRVNSGSQNTLVVEVADTRDAFLDTGILIKGQTFLSSAGALPANIAPIAIGEMVTVLANTARAGNALDNDIDPDGDALTAALDTDAANGAVVLNADGSYIYTPNAGFTGTDSFSYTASDGTAASSPATVTLLVEAGENSAPVDLVFTGDGSIPEDAPMGSVVGVLSATDPDNNPITFTLGSGTPFVIDGNEIKVGEPLDYETVKSWDVEVTANDGANGSITETITIDIEDVEDGELPAVLAFDLAKTSVEPRGEESTWRNPLTNLVYALAAAGYSGPSSPVDDPTGPALARFVSNDGDMRASRIEFDGAEAVELEGDSPALTLDWEGRDATLRLEAPWGNVENIRLDEFTGNALLVANLANVVADWTADSTGRILTVDGAKRGAFELGNGDDTLALLANSNTANATDHFVVSTGGGNDSVYRGESTINYAGLAFETIYDPAATSANVDLGSGNDYFRGGAGVDTVSGGLGRDVIAGGGGNDLLDGNAGADVLLGGVGNDTYHVDNGLDFVDEGGAFPEYLGSTHDVDVLISTADWFWDVYSVAEQLVIAEDAADPQGDGTTIVGSVFSNEMVGNSHTNFLYGRGGNDTYRAGDGLDVISLSTLGVDNLNGYHGVDGTNIVVVEQRQSGASSYDIIYDFESGKDKLDVSDYGYESAGAVYAKGIDDGFGSSYFALGDGLDYVYLVGVTVAQMSSSDFVV